VNLTEWARLQGVHPQTAYRWFREGTLPVPAVRVNSRSVLVTPDAVTASAAAGGLGLYARVSSHGQKPDLDRQVARLTLWATENGLTVGRVVTEVGSALDGARPKLKALLADPDVAVILSRRWSEPEAAFRSWYRGRAGNDFGLGAIQLVQVEPYI
jgi:putative resolvase